VSGANRLRGASHVAEANPAPSDDRADAAVPEASAFHRGVALLLARASVVNAARQVGLARAAYELALDYTQERRAFGKPVAHFQAVAFSLAEMAMEVDAARWMVWRAAHALDRGQPGAGVPAALVQAYQTAFRVADESVQLLGGAGYVQDHPAEKWLRDTKALALFSPPDQLAQLTVAGDELDEALEGPLPSAAIQPFFT
jgi:alkylation response protein AidB-like acyl-CoA dehydrogenase